MEISSAIDACAGSVVVGGHSDESWCSRSGQQKILPEIVVVESIADLWMSTPFFLSTLCYWGGLITRSDFGDAVGSKLCRGAAVLGFTGLLLRWYESYLIGADIGHLPVLDFYEVFILFCMIAALT